MTTPLPSIPYFIAGFGPQQSDMQSLWTNAAAFFQQRVVFRATQTTTATTLPSSGAITTIKYDNIIEDPYSGWVAADNKWKAPLGYSGWYQVTITIWTAAPGAQQTVLNIYISTVHNSNNPLQNTPLTATLLPNGAAGGNATWYVFLSGGDEVGASAAIKNSAGNVLTNLTAGTNSSMEVIWISS